MVCLFVRSFGFDRFNYGAQLSLGVLYCTVRDTMNVCFRIIEIEIEIEIESLAH